MIKKIYFIFILITVVFSVCGCKDQEPPTIENGEFPFKVVYEINGEKFTIEDTVICKYKGLDHSALFGRPRTWDANLESGNEEKTILLKKEKVNSIMKADRINDEIRIVLDYGMGSYYMGDPNAKSYIQAKPHISYREKYRSSPKITHLEGTELNEKELEKYFGIKIIEFDSQIAITN